MHARILMEDVYYEDSRPEPGTDPDSLFFVRIDSGICFGCNACQVYCPTGAIWGETGEPHEILYKDTRRDGAPLKPDAASDCRRRNGTSPGASSRSRTGQLFPRQ
jgi:Pyruvate/2-oxoacid:ferredoxin oxidoreductase delta subunit